MYQDGFVSWSPKDVFEEAYREYGTPGDELLETLIPMISVDYKERFEAEYAELKVRIQKLDAMLQKYKAGTLSFKPTCGYELLFEQTMAMEKYLELLEKRAEIEGITL